jgi:predicted aspartyl protease
MTTTIDGIRSTKESVARDESMGCFRVKCEIQNFIDRTKSIAMDNFLVDTGSEYTWVPAELLEQIDVLREKKDVQFEMANGTIITRSVGFAIVKVEDRFTVDEVVFAEKGDMLLLGARSLEGLNLRVDPRLKKLVAAGPLPAATTSFGGDKT